MPRPVLFAGGKLTSPGQTMFNWIIRNIHQTAANVDAFPKDSGGNNGYLTAVAHFISLVINSTMTLEKFAAQEPKYTALLWDIYELYGPNDIEEQPTQPAPAVPETTEQPTQAQESIAMLESKLNELEALANEPILEQLDFYPEVLVEHRQLTPLGLQIVSLIDNLGMAGRLPASIDVKQYLTYTRVSFGGKPMMTPAAFFREFPGTTTRIVEAILNAPV